MSISASSGNNTHLTFLECSKVQISRSNNSPFQIEVPKSGRVERRQLKKKKKKKKHTHTHKEKYRQKLCKQRQGELLVVAENFLLAEVTNAL